MLTVLTLPSQIVGRNQLSKPLVHNYTHLQKFCEMSLFLSLQRGGMNGVFRYQTSLRLQWIIAKKYQYITDIVPTAGQVNALQCTNWTNTLHCKLPPKLFAICAGKYSSFVCVTRCRSLVGDKRGVDTCHLVKGRRQGDNSWRKISPQFSVVMQGN